MVVESGVRNRRNCGDHLGDWDDVAARPYGVADGALSGSSTEGLGGADRYRRDAVVAHRTEERNAIAGQERFAGSQREHIGGKDDFRNDIDGSAAKIGARHGERSAVRRYVDVRRCACTGWIDAADYGKRICEQSVFSIRLALLHRVHERDEQVSDRAGAAFWRNAADWRLSHGTGTRVHVTNCETAHRGRGAAGDGGDYFSSSGWFEAAEIRVR